MQRKTSAVDNIYNRRNRRPPLRKKNPVDNFYTQRSLQNLHNILGWHSRHAWILVDRLSGLYFPNEHGIQFCPTCSLYFPLKHALQLVLLSMSEYFPASQALHVADAVPWRIFLVHKAYNTHHHGSFRSNGNQEDNYNTCGSINGISCTIRTWFTFFVILFLNLPL